MPRFQWIEEKGTIKVQLPNGSYTFHQEASYSIYDHGSGSMELRIFNREGLHTKTYANDEWEAVVWTNPSEMEFGYTRDRVSEKKSADRSTSEFKEVPSLLTEIKKQQAKVNKLQGQWDEATDHAAELGNIHTEAVDYLEQLLEEDRKRKRDTITQKILLDREFENSACFLPEGTLLVKHENSVLRFGVTELKFMDWHGEVVSEGAQRGLQNLVRSAIMGGIGGGE